MELFKAKDLNYSYPNCNCNALKGVNFAIEQGDFVLVCGDSGSGKTTLLKHFKPTMVQGGNKSGELYYCGENIESISPEKLTSEIGYISQDPSEQIACDKVWHEIAFLGESLGMENAKMKTAIAEMVSFFGIEDLFYKNTNELSGGEMQLVNLASVMIGNPKVLVLDEPTTMLDPVGAKNLVDILGRINRELGVTIIVCEHKLEYIYSLADMVMVLDRGEILSYDTPENTVTRIKEHKSTFVSALPSASYLFAMLDGVGEIPTDVKSGKSWLHNFAKDKELKEVIHKNKDLSDVVIDIKSVHFAYGKNEKDVVKGAKLQVHKGELMTLVGGNGAGKSTLLKLVASILKPLDGKIKINGSIGYLPQKADMLFCTDSVMLDIESVSENKELIKQMIEFCGLSHLLNRNPFDLSGGEKKRLALCKVLLKKPSILLLDEPTDCLDYAFKTEFASMLKSLCDSGITVLMVSHDIDFCAENADRCALFFDGNISCVGAPQDFFMENHFYTTSVCTIARDVIPGAICRDDVLCAFSVDKPKREEKKIDVDFNNTVVEEQVITTVKKKKPLPLIISAFLLVPLTIFCGVNYFGENRYLFTSLLVMLECILPIFFVYEKRKPDIKEIVLLAVLCALGVASREALYMLPQFKMVSGLVIVIAISLGAENGFLCGAFIMLVSDIFFSLGVWTPWQMFAMGLLGLVSGFVFRVGLIKQKRIPMALYSFFATIIIYGGIMNPASIIMSHMELNAKSLMTFYIAGLPFDAIHGLASALFVGIFGLPIIKKLNRVINKYNIFPNVG